MGVTITIGYPTRKPLVPGKRGPTPLERFVLLCVFQGESIYEGGRSSRTYSQAAARCRRLGLLVQDDDARFGLRLTTAGLAAVRS